MIRISKREKEDIPQVHVDLRDDQEAATSAPSAGDIHPTHTFAETAIHTRDASRTNELETKTPYPYSIARRRSKFIQKWANARTWTFLPQNLTNTPKIARCNQKTPRTLAHKDLTPTNHNADKTRFHLECLARSHTTIFPHHPPLCSVAAYRDSPATGPTMVGSVTHGGTTLLKNVSTNVSNDVSVGRSRGRCMCQWVGATAGATTAPGVTTRSCVPISRECSTR
jgi:hypothetical protein